MAEQLNVLFAGCDVAFVQLGIDEEVKCFDEEEKFELTATLSDGEPNVPVEFRRDGQVIDTVNTNGNGVAVLEDEPPAPGAYIYKATRNGYAGSNEIKAMAVQVSFDPSPIRTGFTIPDQQLTIRTDVTATVVPAEAAPDVELFLTGEVSVVFVGQPVVDAQAGTVKFVVRGLQATPANQPDGDTTIEASIGEHTCGEVNAVVVVPARIRQPYPQAADNVMPQNLVLHAGTSPAWVGLPAGSVALVTDWGHVLTVTVENQFGEVLDDLYEGSPVFEWLRATRRWENINQALTANGTYQDPVGVWAWPANHIVPPNDPAAQNWPAANTLPMVPVTDRQRIPVRVGGHNIGIIRRDVIGTPPNHVEIKWPP